VRLSGQLRQNGESTDDATGCGIVGSVGIIIMVANLDYFIDRDEIAR